LIISDSALCLLSIFGYYLIPYLRPPGFYIFIYNALLLMVILLLLRKKVVLIFLLPVLALFFLLSFLMFSLKDYHYSYIKSPGRTETLIVKYRVATLGESSYFFEFYQQSNLGMLMKKLEGQEYNTIIRSGDYQTPEEVLGIDYAEWSGEKKVIFSTVRGEEQIVLH